MQTTSHLSITSGSIVHGRVRASADRPDSIRLGALAATVLAVILALAVVPGMAAVPTTVVAPGPIPAPAPVVGSPTR